MKAKIKRTMDGGSWIWEIYCSNGTLVCESFLYTRRDNAIRGLERFLDGVRYEHVCLDGMLLG